MKQPNTSSRRWKVSRTLSLAVLATGLSPSIVAQSNSENEGGDPVFELDPFTVTGDRDIGYRAATTLSGTRTNSDLKDVANPLDIFTAELMQDLAVQDIQDLVDHANGVEANAAGGYNELAEEREVWNYNYMQIRGFKTGTVTRNFMDLNAQYESYNSQRVEFSKGPNAILSGSGNPGGTVNFSTKTPELHRSAHSIQHQTDDLGSQRLSLDANQAVLPEKFAVRLNALWEDQKFYREPSYEKQEAWHLMAKWKASENTSLTFGHERRSSDRASPRGIYPRDWVTSWLDAGSPQVVDVPRSSRVVIVGDESQQVAGDLGMSTFSRDHWVLDSDGNVVNKRLTARGERSYVNGREMDIVATDLDFPRDVWTGGPNGIHDSDWDITEANLTHKVADGFYIDLSMGRTDNNIKQGSSVSRDIHIDPNYFDGNTHAGEYYVDTRPFWITRDINVDHYRATLSYDLRPENPESWFGRHQIAAAYEYNDREEVWNNGRLTLTATPDGPLDPTDYSTGFRNSALAFNLREYITGKDLPAMRDFRDLYYSDGVNQDGYVAEFLRRESWASLHTLAEQDSMLGVLQSHWLKERLVTTVGLRKDKRRVYTAPFVRDAVTDLWEPEELLPGSPEGADHPRYAAFINGPEVSEAISRNYGAVLHTTDWLSFTLNYATNFAPKNEPRGLYGDFIPSSTGESTDFGVRFNLLDNRLHITAVHYETNELGSPANSSSVSSPFENMLAAEEILVENGLLPSTPLVSGWTTADRAAEGQEILIYANPTPNWNIRLSASKLDNQQTNIAPEVRAYYLEHLPFYEAQDPTLTQAGSGSTLGLYVERMKERYALMDSMEKVSVFPAHEYTVVSTVRYTFDRDSALKGLAAGGTLRWKSAPVIGYYLTDSGMFDVNREHRGEAPTSLDMFLRYSRNLSDDLKWSLQLNVRNVLDDTDLYPITARNDFDGEGFSWVATDYRPVDGRTFILTNTFSF